MFSNSTALLLAAGALLGQPAASRYPKIDAVSGDKVDPTWPSERVPGDVWAAMSSVTLGPDGNVWTFNRGKLTVQVYTPAGKLLKSWGAGLFKNPHTLRFDPEENLWASDTRTHTLRKFTPDGKLLMTLGTPDQPGEDATHFISPTIRPSDQTATSTSQTDTETTVSRSSTRMAGF